MMSSVYFSARPVIEADERMIRQTQTILALKQLTVLGGDADSHKMV